MSDKELLQKLKKALEQSRKLKQGSNDDLEEKGMTGNKGRSGPVKTIGSHPGVGKWLDSDEDKQKGYSSIFMLSFITLFFQLLFIVVAYFIYK